jgi:hypothetical protein
MNQFHSAESKLFSSLEKIAQYECPAIVDRFVEEVGVNPDEACEIFEDVKKWLYLVSRYDDLPMPAQMYVVDEMWHTFLMFTREYREFCVSYLGMVVDHIPEDPKEMEVRTGYNMRSFIELVYDELGEDTAIRWFADLPNRYNPKSLTLRKLELLRGKLADYKSGVSDDVRV